MRLLDKLEKKSSLYYYYFFLKVYDIWSFLSCFPEDRAPQNCRNMYKYMYICINICIYTYILVDQKNWLNCQVNVKGIQIQDSYPLNIQSLLCVMEGRDRHLPYGLSPFPFCISSSETACSQTLVSYLYFLLMIPLNWWEYEEHVPPSKRADFLTAWSWLNGCENSAGKIESM